MTSPTLKDRLQGELIGEDSEPVNAGKYGNAEIRAQDDLRQQQRDSLLTVLSHIAADVEGLIEDWINHERSCAWVWRNADKCDCHVSQIKAALGRYMKGE